MLAAFLAGSLLLDLAVGYGRAALVPEVGMADRYAILSLPGLVGAWFAWQLYGPARARAVAHGALLVAAVVLLPYNVERGEAWRDWYVAGAAAVNRDIDAGLGRDELVRRHGKYLMHWDDRRLAWGIDILRDEGVGPFARLREEPRATR
jgi:hypothetical protein